MTDRLKQQLTTHGPAIAGYVIPGALLLVLALNKGGYDPVVRGEIGLVIWWAVLLGTCIGVLPVARWHSAAWVAVGALFAFGIWTVAAVLWTESIERTFNEAARMTTLLGVMVLGLMLQVRGGLRRTVATVAAVISGIAVLALMSRLEPSLLPTFDPDGLLTASSYRLSQPVGYWNGLAGLMAIGMPLALWGATTGRSIAFRSLMASGVPIMGTVIFYTVSRGGVGAALIGVSFLFALYPRRLELALKSAPAALGTLVLVFAANRRQELADGLLGTAYTHQASEMLTLSIVVVVVVALMQASLMVAERREVGPRVSVSRRTAALVAAALVVTVGIGMAAADAPSRVDSAWQTFKTEGSPGSGTARLSSSAGNSRYQYWQRSVDAYSTEPVLGRGPGTYEFWWARHATVPGFVRDAHSLFLQTLAETGLVGLVLIVVFFGTVLVTGTGRALGRGSPDRRGLVAAATAGVVAFVATAAIDWSWQLTVLPAAALLLSGAVVGPDARTRRGVDTRFMPVTSRPLAIGAAALVAIPCVALLTISISTNRLIEQSQAEYRRGDTAAALESARAAVRTQPWAATPRVQEAMLLRSAGDVEGSLAAARTATQKEPTNWRVWLVRTDSAAVAGRSGEAIRSYRRAKELNPRSRLFRLASQQTGTRG